MSPNPYQDAVAAADAARRREAVVAAAAAQAVRVLRTVGAHRLTRAMIAEVRRAQIEVALHALDRSRVLPQHGDTGQP